MKNKFLLLLSLAVFSASLNAQNLVSATYLGSKTQSQLFQQFNNLPFIQYGAKYYRLAYSTPDVHGVLDTATGLLVIPDNPGKVYPRLVYQHGTSGSKIDVPSINVLVNGEGQLGQLFAGLGYVALLPDYLGLGNESRGFHPYVHAASEASAALDMLRASATFCEQNQIRFNEQLFVTGYSQGGHAAMALQRAVENDPTKEFVVTAGSHMSGPYSISGVMRQLILSDDIYYYPAYLPNTALSFQTVYGNLFQNLEEFFKPAYASLIADFYSGQTTLSQLNEQLIATLTANEGACKPFRMLQPAAVDSITNNPQHPINLALADNDTYNHWVPKAPTHILYCMNDDQVPFGNSLLARDSLMAAGAINLLAQDVNSSADHGECVTPAVTGTLIFFLTFQQIGTSSAEETMQEIDWNIFPNPASEHLNINGLPAAGRVEILDFQGKMVREFSVLEGDNMAYLDGLANGVYALKYSSNNRVAWAKLVVERK